MNESTQRDRIRIERSKTSGVASLEDKMRKS